MVPMNFDDFVQKTPNRLRKMLRNLHLSLIDINYMYVSFTPMRKPIRKHKKKARKNEMDIYT